MNLADFGSIAGVVLGLAALVTAVRQGRRSFRAETRATVYLEILEIAERRSSYVQSMSARHSARPAVDETNPGPDLTEPPRLNDLPRSKALLVFASPAVRIAWAKWETNMSLLELAVWATDQNWTFSNKGPEDDLDPIDVRQEASLIPWDDISRQQLGDVIARELDVNN